MRVGFKRRSNFSILIMKFPTLYRKYVRYHREVTKVTNSTTPPPPQVKVGMELYCLLNRAMEETKALKSYSGALIKCS